MTAQKTTTMIYRHINFKSGGSGPSKFLKSVAHSLRILPTEENRIKYTKKQEWDESRSKMNLIYCPALGQKILRLDSLTEEQKVKIQESFITKIVDDQKIKDEKSELLDTLSKYKAKINKWLNSIGDDEPLKVYLAKILDEKEFVDIEKTKSELEQFEFARKKQKTESVKKFLDLHNKVVDNNSDLSRNKIFVQESFFKFPLHNNVDASAGDLMSNLQSFYSDNFPDYPIRLIIFHGDEKGDHPHIFVDAKNKRTGKYDLLTAQKNFVNNNIDKLKDEYLDAEPLAFCRDENDYLNKKLQAQYFQTLFYQHSNKMLVKYDVEAKKLEKTQENNARMALIVRDAKKPKVEREFSYYNAETARIRGEYDIATLDAFNAVKQQNLVEDELNFTTKSLSETQTQLLEAQNEFNELNKRLPALRSETKELTAIIPKLKNTQKELKRKNEELEPKALQYNEISEAYEVIKPKYEKIVEDYLLIIERSKKQIFDGLREVFSVMWGLMEFGEGKLTFSSLIPFGKKKLKGAPKDIQEWDSRVETLTRMAVDKTIDTFIEMDFLIPKEPLAQAFKEKVIEERNKPDRNERHNYLGKGVDLNYAPPTLKETSKSKLPNDPRANKLFAEADMNASIANNVKPKNSLPQ